MGYTLIIAEKPAAAKKIAEALSTGKLLKRADNSVPYYELEHSGEKIFVVSAVGHLYGLAQKVKSSGTPVFDIEWKPSYEVSKDSDYTKKYISVIKKLSKHASDFVIATDKDIEGELLGFNALRFACGKKDAKRMEFSTLTKPDLVASFSKLKQHVDHPLIEAGETRHFLDYYYGINISRALMSAIKRAGTFKILSTGRVQGPALKILSDREKEIQSFKPVPYWELELLSGTVPPFEAFHEIDKFWKKDDAHGRFVKICKEKKAVVNSVDKKSYEQSPHFPFDLTTLQTEAHRALHMPPKRTSDIAQELYTGGFISYPRTSSQQLPPAIEYKSIISSLGRQPSYSSLAKKLLSQKSLVPNNGKKTDPAHPAIYPTGVVPEKLGEYEKKLYDLVVKRFLATFGEPAVRETMTVNLVVKSEIFVAKGTRTIKDGWHELYRPYVQLEEITLPLMVEKSVVPVKKISLNEKETQPPKRYTQSSIIKELEQRELGTKATRADIIETLAKRSYVTGDPISVTDLGMKTIQTLEKNIPEITDEEMTRTFEKEMDSIQEGKAHEDGILVKARREITKILEQFEKKEDSIGRDLKTTFEETRGAMSRIGSCIKCNKGDLTLKKGKFGMFVACTNYPECTATFALPRNALTQPTEKICQSCNYPIVKIIRKGKRPQEHCINQDCPAKKKVESGKSKEGQKCPKCSDGKLVLRRSFYGEFYACNQYPKCRTIVKKE